MFDFDFDALPDEIASATNDIPDETEHFSIFAVSDIHTDKKDNMNEILSWPCRPQDVLIVAGDVSNDLEILRDTFKALKERFGHVFFCPGNHDLWLHHKDGCKDSIEKLHKIEALCKELGIRTAPGWIDNVLVVPLLSWYNSSFDIEPDVSDPSLLPVEHVMVDFGACKWPQGLTAFDGSDSIARFIDSLNDDIARSIPPQPLLPDGKRAKVISFSHFLPRLELMPEKRSLYYPPLPKAVGSNALQERVSRLHPDLHIFGHTHYGWSQEVDGINYLQACLAYPRERADRPFSVYCKGSSEEELKAPLCVYKGETQSFPVYRGFWSEYYKSHKRYPENVEWIYREPRKKKDVTEAIKRLINETSCTVIDANVEMMLHNIAAC
eukprot:TRINITY_DN3560_c0_g2_i1.p1 TRINITY_DN3560_c0_g2~~TRINITY_DN3560_c0_g2_i1.p1  ORF type:complete len:393 (-),score=58.22 TRINITY_DN3560_c0_g2_i1:168-1310(-)